jgi:hypothetical protein
MIAATEYDTRWSRHGCTQHASPLETEQVREVKLKSVSCLCEDASVHRHVLRASTTRALSPGRQDRFPGRSAVRASIPGIRPASAQNQAPTA